MFQIGDYCKRRMSPEEAQARVDRDLLKAKQEGCQFFCGKAAAYMHTNQPYRIVGFTVNGGLRLEGFSLTVSPDDVKPATGNEKRGPGLRWGK